MDISWASTMCRLRTQAYACVGSEQLLYHSGARSRKAGDKGSVLSTVLEPTKCLAKGSFFVTASVTSEETEARRRGEREATKIGGWGGNNIQDM